MGLRPGCRVGGFGPGCWLRPRSACRNRDAPQGCQAHPPGGAGLQVDPPGPETSILAERLHRQLLRSSGDIHFATLFLGLLDPRSHRLEYVNAGHNPPLLLCDKYGCKDLGPTGMPMGLIEGAEYRVDTVDLSPNCLLCIFTDGITEAMARDSFYGEERLLESVKNRSGKPLPEIVDGVIWELRAFLGDHVLQDDVTMLLLRRKA